MKKIFNIEVRQGDYLIFGNGEFMGLTQDKRIVHDLKKDGFNVAKAEDLFDTLVNPITPDTGEP